MTGWFNPRNLHLSSVYKKTAYSEYLGNSIEQHTVFCFNFFLTFIKFIVARGERVVKIARRVTDTTGQQDIGDILNLFRSYGFGIYERRHIDPVTSEGFECYLLRHELYHLETQVASTDFRI